MMRILLVLLISLLPIPVLADTERTGQTEVTVGCKVNEDFFKGREDGWFWYKECKPVKKEKKQYRILPQKIEIPWDIIDKLDPEEIAKLEETSRKIVVMYPTKENLEEYRKLTTYIAQKAWEFAKADLLYRTSSSAYAAVSPYVGSDFRSEQWRQVKNQKREATLRRYRENAGLLVFYRKDCPFCEKQKVPVDAFQNKWGWEIKWVDVEQHPVLASRLGTEVVPDIILVLNRNGKPVLERVGSGLLTRTEIEDGILYALYRIGEIKDEDFIFE